MNAEQEIRDAFFERLDRPLLAESLFDQVPDIAFFVKDHLGRYVCANQTLVERCGFSSKDEIIGKTVHEVYPAQLADTFADQDHRVVKYAESVRGRLELHLYPGGKEGWCLTYKEPILDTGQRIIGVSGISRDLHAATQKSETLADISRVLRYIRENIDQPLRLSDLASMVDMSVYQLDQRIRELYHISAGQCITRTRIDAACYLLITTESPIARVALDCGYSDQSAFTRQFKQTTGVTPKAYRESRRG